MKAIAFTGLPGAGKTEAIKVAELLDIPVVSMGDEVRNELENRNLALTDKNLGFIADSMRKKYGMDIWAKRCIKNLYDYELLVIDGVRNIEEVETFKKNITMFLMIAIHTNPKIRYNRIILRQRSDDYLSINDIQSREKRELKWGLGALISMADVVITNNGTVDELHEKIKQIFLYYS